MNSRRSFLRQSAVASLAVVGNSLIVSPSLEKLVLGAETASAQSGIKLGNVLFIGEDVGEEVGEDEIGEEVKPFGEVYGRGLAGRLLNDLAKIDEGHLVTSNDEFFIRTTFPDGLDLSQHDPWTIRVHGLVDRPMQFTPPDLAHHVQPMGTHLLECSGNTGFGGFGLLSAANWSGFPVTDVLDRIKIKSSATGVLISGFDVHSQTPRKSRPGASWVITFDQLASTGAFFATRMNDKPLPKDHGFPIRLIIPGWYGCTCAKWVNDIKLVDDREPATAQMIEFASRTHQAGKPKLAKDYKPANIDQTGMPIRVEQWRVDGQLEYRITGILWGGDRPTNRLMIRFKKNSRYYRVQSYDHRTNKTWTLWRHTWRPEEPGQYRIQLAVDDASISTRRLDRGFYARTVEIKEV